MISVIVPSRNRPNELKVALDSLELKKHSLEALVWLDEDEPQIDKYKEFFGKDPNIRLFIKKRVGYQRFHEMMNFLSSKAKYDWIFEFNDDAFLESTDWFEKFQGFVKDFDPKKEPIVINIWEKGGLIYNLLPMVSRKFIEILGHFSLFYACDTWIQTVGVKSDIHHILRGIKAVHRKFGDGEPLVDQTFHETEEIRNKIKWTINPGKSPYKELLEEDIKKINEFKTKKYN